MAIEKLNDLTPDSKNARRHNVRNIGMIEESIRQVGVARSGVIDENGVILAGNGTFEALAAAGIERIKVVPADGDEWVVVQRTNLTEEQKQILSILDNRSSELASWDVEKLHMLDIDLEPWFLIEELEELEGLIDEREKVAVDERPSVDPMYTWKIEVPTYEPRNEKPSSSSLCDSSRVKALLLDIEAAPLPEEEKDFLRMAAWRHAVFHYERIADYYAHASREMQQRMKKSALIILDFNSAIEQGFVRICQSLEDLFHQDDVSHTA